MADATHHGKREAHAGVCVTSHALGGNSAIGDLNRGELALG